MLTEITYQPTFSSSGGWHHCNIFQPVGAEVLALLSAVGPHECFSQEWLPHSYDINYPKVTLTAERKYLQQLFPHNEAHYKRE